MNNNEDLETPTFQRKKSVAKTKIFLVTDNEYEEGVGISVLESYRTVKRLMNEARTHFEVTLTHKRKVLIMVEAVKSILELE